MNPKALQEESERLFSQRGTLTSLWQHIAENFYPERADFTVTRSLGDDFAENLTTSYPVMVRRDLGNSFSTMMRPTQIDWFKMRAAREEWEDQAAKEWLEYAGGVQRRAMYDRKSQFVRASKESDHDVATFGQSVKTVELNGARDGLLYRCWHLRDVVWSENSEGIIDTAFRKWKPTVRDLCAIFGDKCHQKVKDKLIGGQKDPYAKVPVLHIVKPASECEGEWPGKGRTEFVEIYLDTDNDHIMEMVGLPYFKYIIPRWQTVSGSQYSFSPATTIALPDARLIQAMSRTLLEAGEKFTNPPMIAVQEALRSDVAIYAGGITWVDSDYDERMGQVLRPLGQDKSGMPIGFDMAADIRGQLQEAFYLSKLSLPVSGPEMTAYEVAQRVQDYIRQASPLFEPLEDEDNGATCETTFQLLMMNGAFGPVDEIPQSLRGKDITFKFESPLHEAIEKQKGAKFMEAKAMLADTLALDPTAASNLDIQTAFRDVLMSIGMPAKWMRSEADAEAMIEEQKAQQQAAAMIETMGAGAEVAAKMGEAQQNIGDMAL